MPSAIPGWLPSAMVRTPPAIWPKNGPAPSGPSTPGLLDGLAELARPTSAAERLAELRKTSLIPDPLGGEASSPPQSAPASWLAGAQWRGMPATAWPEASATKSAVPRDDADLTPEMHRAMLDAYFRYHSSKPRSGPELSAPPPVIQASVMPPTSVQPDPGATAYRAAPNAASIPPQPSAPEGSILPTTIPIRIDAHRQDAVGPWTRQQGAPPYEQFSYLPPTLPAQNWDQVGQRRAPLVPWPNISSPAAWVQGPTQGGTTTLTHEDLKAEASKYAPSPMVFGLSDVAKWKTDPEYLSKFKDRFVYENRELITAAAKKYDLPEELVAGVVRIEIGGKDPIKDPWYWGRSLGIIPGDKDKTSLGQQAMQVRRAAETLGYDPRKLTNAQRAEILKSLRDPAQSIFLAAKHLSDLRDIDSAGKVASDLTPDDIKVIGARYNQGSEKPLSVVRKDLSYGESIVKRWSQLGSLLNVAPEKLEYAPIQNSVVRPADRWLWRFEREFRRLYGIPY